MFFLIRVAFWLSIVVILLPTGSQQSSATIETAEAVSAASAAVSDMRQFCSRQPEACSIGSQAAVAFGYKAQAGAKMLYDFLTEALAPSETGSVASSTDKREATVKSQHTLLPSDIAPAWRGPVLPRPDPRSKHSA